MFNETLKTPKGHVTIYDANTGNVLVDKDNIVVSDARFSILHAIAGDVIGHIASIKMGFDFVSTWTSSGITATTDFYDGRKLVVSSDPSSLFTGTNNYIKVGPEVREITSFTTTHIFINQPFDTPLNSTPFDYYSGNYTENNPEPPALGYDENSMEIAYDSTLTSSPLNFSVSSTTPAKLTITHEVHGSDLMNQNAGKSFLNLYSCALHTSNGKVFSYLRIPRLGVTATITLKIVWTLEF